MFALTKCPSPLQKNNGPSLKLISFGQPVNPIYQKTFSTSPFVTLKIPCRPVKTCTSGESPCLLNVRFAFILKPYYMSSLAAFPLWISLLGDTTLFLILLPTTSSQIILFKKIFADLASFFNILIITGDIYRPHLLNLTKDNTLYVVELTVGYETNLKLNPGTIPPAYVIISARAYITILI